MRHLYFGGPLDSQLAQERCKEFDEVAVEIREDALCYPPAWDSRIDSFTHVPDMATCERCIFMIKRGGFVS